MASPATMAPTAATIVTQTRVQPEHAEEFARWQEQLNGVIAHVPGYIDHEIIPPAPPEQVDWVIVQRFATVDTARDWLDSETRQHLVDQVLPW